MSQAVASIGIICGSGLYEFFGGPAEEFEVATDYGRPSDKIAIGSMFGHSVAFLPRHGKKHSIPPHKIPFKANIEALRLLGVRQIIAPCAVGSLKAEIEPGHFVICDQVVDRTKNRADTFFDGPSVAHIEMAHPYCGHLREIAIEAARDLDLTCHTAGTVVVIEGPRFSTTAESLWFSQMGWDVVNMTQYPEVVLAAERGICYANISLVTDYDAGIYAKETFAPVTIEQIMTTFKQNTEKLKILISRIIENIPNDCKCECEQRAERARIT